MKIKKILVCLVAVLLVTAVMPHVETYAESRTPTISGPGNAQIGKTFKVDLGFSRKANTRSCNFVVNYDKNLIQLISIENISGMLGTTHPTSNDIARGDYLHPLRTVFSTGEIASISKVLRIEFKVLAKGSVTITVSGASDGEESNTVTGSASRTITLTDPPPTTTTAPRTTTTTTPKETQPRHPGETVIGKRYDGIDLSVSVSLPDEEHIPNSYGPAEVEWGDKYLEGYRSENLPYILYWLTDEAGVNGFYLYDLETSVFVPYLRTGWSSRFYTFSVIPAERIPQGFELATVSVWGKGVPGYKPVEGAFVSKKVYDQLFPLAEAGEEPQELSDEARLLPADLYLIAVRINDAEEKVLCLYDAVLDSIIRSDLWLVPLGGSFLDPAYQASGTEPEETGPLLPTDTTPPDPGPPEMADKEGPWTVSLFGMELPLYLVAGTGAIVLLMLALAVWFFIRAKRASENEPELTVADLRESDDLFPDSGAKEGSESEPDPPELPLRPQEEDPPQAQEAVHELPAEGEDGWEELKETLFGREKEEDSRPDKRPPGIRPSIHRRAERDDPGDVEEL